VEGDYPQDDRPRLEALPSSLVGGTVVLLVNADARAPRVARAWVRDVLSESLASTVMGDVCTVVSELVSNSVLHTASTTVSLRLLRVASRVRLEVWDHGSGLPAVLPIPREYGGRGLALVARVATRWSAGTTAGQAWVAAEFDL
jgi:anti-sigma regulatory factor (Ser/Thr protein kinase)